MTSAGQGDINIQIVRSHAQPSWVHIYYWDIVKPKLKTLPKALLSLCHWCGLSHAFYYADQTSYPSLNWSLHNQMCGIEIQALLSNSNIPKNEIQNRKLKNISPCWAGESHISPHNSSSQTDKSRLNALDCPGWIKSLKDSARKLLLVGLISESSRLKTQDPRYGSK